ncbi:hypothetical protein Tco_0215188 [Tanacetum coccineum]
MYNNILAVGSRDRPPMLATGRYAQWKSRFMRYVDTKANNVAIKKCIHQVPETFMNISPENKAPFDSEAGAIYLILTGIGDDIYSNVDACTTAKDMWIAIKRFYKMMNEMNDNQTGQFGNQRIVTVAGARATIVKDYTYQKEKMLMCKQAEKGVPLRTEQSDWLDDTDKEIDEQELEAQYSFMAKIQEVLTADSGSDAEPLEKYDSNVIPDSSNICDHVNQADQNAKECDDECAVLANLIANLKLDTDKNKKIQKQLKKENTSLAHELQECKYALEK